MTKEKEIQIGEYFTIGNWEAAIRYIGYPFLTGIEVNKTVLRLLEKTKYEHGSNIYLIEKITDKIEVKYMNNLNLLNGTVVAMKDNAEKTQNDIRLRLAHNNSGLFTVGTDPEMFVLKNKKVLPAFDFLGEKPKTEGRNPAAYWDGFQAEYNTPATSCLAWQIDHIRNGMADLHEKAQKVGGKLTIKSVVGVTLSSLAKLPKDKVEFGCTPSINAYGEAVPIPDGKDVNFRMAGGHLHLGCGRLQRHGKKGEALDKTDTDIVNVIKALDRTLGVMSVALFYGLEDKRRRDLYGRAGEYRTPKHGIEYRVLSNAWLVHPVMANLVFEVARVVAGTAVQNSVQPGKNFYNFLTEMDTTDEEVQDIINNLDIRKARAYIKKHENVFKALLMRVTNHITVLDQWYGLLLRGVATRLRKDHSLEKAWYLNGGWETHNESPGRNISKFSYELLTHKTKEPLLLAG